MRRFVADWIEDMDDDGTDKHSSSTHWTLEAAQAAAVAASRKAGAIEWVCVREQVWQGDKRTGRWETVARWTGDWDTLEQSA
jgi:hypothetical protein